MAAVAQVLSQIITLVLTIATMLGVLILLVTAAADLRDRAIEAGMLGTDNRFIQGYRRRRISALIPILEALGFDAAARQAIREASGQPQRPTKPISRPDRAFLDRASGWIRKLDGPDNYRGSQYYLDLMGAIYGRAGHERGIDQIFAEWFRKLQQGANISTPDLLLAPKDGNVLLCRQLAEQLDLPLVLCKGDHDKSRIVGSNGNIHETDFEGLRAFCDREISSRTGSENRTYRALIIDDSCKNGSQLQSVAMRFKKLFDNHQNGLALKFEPATDAVVLFRSLAGTISDQGLSNASLNLHALVAVGAQELQNLYENRSSGADNSEYKKDSSCTHSLRLFEGDENDRHASKQKPAGPLPPDTNRIEVGVPAETTDRSQNVSRSDDSDTQGENDPGEKDEPTRTQSSSSSKSRSPGRVRRRTSTNTQARSSSARRRRK